MNELQARSLSVLEIAYEYRDHADPAVSKLAKAGIDGFTDPEIDEEIEHLRAEVDNVNSTCSDLEIRINDLCDLLTECMDEDIPESLKARIRLEL